MVVYFMEAGALRGMHRLSLFKNEKGSKNMRCDRSIDFSKSVLYDAKVFQSSKQLIDVQLGKNGGGVSLEGVPTAGKRYIVGYITILETHSLPMTLRFFCYGEKEERAHIRFTLLPNLKTKVYFDLAWLNLNRGGLGKTPGSLKKVMYGTRTDISEVERIELGVKPVFHDVHVIFEDFELTDEEPKDFPLPDKKMVDKFGQYKEKEWPGKIHSQEQLADTMHKNEGPAVWGNSSWNKWGGDSKRKLKEGSGFFSTCKTKDGRWHLTDPDGYDFFSIGICCTRPQNMGDITGVKSLLEWLPNEKEETYRFYCSREHPWFGTKMEQFDFLSANLYRVYGETWKEKGEELAHHILMSNGVNTQGNGPAMNVNNGSSKIPYTRQLPEFPSTKINIFRDFPDVLSPEYADSSAECAKVLREWKEDSWMIGYFLRNEPQFNFVAGISIANEVLHNPANTYCRQGLKKFLIERYKTVASLNQAWQADFAGFDCLDEPFDDCIKKYPGSREDLREYSVYLVSEYCRIPCDACRKEDPNHLILGLRWSKMNNPDMLSGWQFMDVFSFNCYLLEPLTDMNFVTNAGVDRPLLIGEYHAGALDRGLTCTCIKGVASQEDRRLLWREFVESCAAHPFGVGAHWFEFTDEFILGRFDGENYQIGIVDICMQPYQEITQGIHETAQVIYQVKNGECRPFDKMPKAIPMIG